MCYVLWFHYVPLLASLPQVTKALIQLCFLKRGY